MVCGLFHILAQASLNKGGMIFFFFRTEAKAIKWKKGKRYSSI